jgi:hypothetical protein
LNHFTVPFSTLLSFNLNCVLAEECQVTWSGKRGKIPAGETQNRKSNFARY